MGAEGGNMHRSIAAIASVLGLVLLSACVWSSGSEEDFPELTPFPPAMEGRLHEIRDKVAEIRGLPVNEEAQEGLLTTEALQEYGRNQFAALEDEDAEEVAAAEAMMALLGLAPRGYTFAEDYASDSAGIVAGQYYFEADRLVLVGEAAGELSIADELTLAHEYVHSLQDREFDLGKFLVDWTELQLEEDGYSSYADTLSCLIEGDADLADRLYAEAVLGDDWREQLAAESAADEPFETDLPEFMLRSVAFNYTECVSFVEALYEDGGWDAVNAAYEDPPATQEQVLDPDKYRAGELASSPKPDSLEDELDGWSEAFEGQFGQFDAFNYVITRTGNFSAALTGSEGWGSGWIRTYRDDKDAARIAVDITFRWDSGEDYVEFLGAIVRVVESYGVKPEDIKGEDLFRWTALEEYGQYGALILDEGSTKTRIIFATDEEARAMFLPAD
jgi:hypothetical protein